jgi:hypothetical protein
MSYTQHTATATCTIKHVLDVNDLCHQLYDYFTNHEDEIPEGLADCNSVEEFSEVVESYVALVDNKLIVTMDTEESNCDSEIFDAISSHYAHLMSSKFMKVTWVTYDSREGLLADVNYYDSNNELINVEALI